MARRASYRSRSRAQQEAIGETRLQISDLRIQRMEEIDAEFAEVQMERGEAEEQLAAARDKLRRTEIVAPVAGTVLNSRFKTTGGVIGPGDPILDLVPLGEELIIEARVSPTDIEEVAPGQDASCHVSVAAAAERAAHRRPGA